MRPRHSEHGFGLVAAMFVVIIIAVVIAAMAQLAVTQNATNSLSIQQARAYQAARAGLEVGLFRVTQCFITGASPPTAVPMSFSIDSFTVTLSALTPDVPAGSTFEEEDAAKHYFYRIEATAQSGLAGSADYAYRRLEVIAEAVASATCP